MLSDHTKDSRTTQSTDPRTSGIPPLYYGGAEAGAATRRAILARQMLRDPFIDRVMRESRTDEDAFFALAADRERLVARVMELEGIAPRRMKMPDGRHMVWHCPDDLIPVTDMSGMPLTVPPAACPPPATTPASSQP